MDDITVNGTCISDSTVEVFTQWQLQSDSISGCYLRVIEDIIDYLVDETTDTLPADNILGKIKTLRMMKKDIEVLSNI